MDKKTIIVGASTNPERYAYKAAQSLAAHGIDFELVGIKEGAVLGHSIHRIQDFPVFNNIHTVTLYIGAQHQSTYFDYIIKVIQPSRVVFNPGTENPDFYRLLKASNIAFEEACTLVLLSTGQY